MAIGIMSYLLRKTLLPTFFRLLLTHLSYRFPFHYNLFTNYLRFWQGHWWPSTSSRTTFLCPHGNSKIQRRLYNPTRPHISSWIALPWQTRDTDHQSQLYGFVHVWFLAALRVIRWGDLMSGTVSDISCPNQTHNLGLYIKLQGHLYVRGLYSLLTLHLFNVAWK